MVRYYGYYSNVSRGKRKKESPDHILPFIIEEANFDIGLNEIFAQAEDIEGHLAYDTLVIDWQPVWSVASSFPASNYNYNLFTLTDIDPNIGGAIGVVTFNLSSYLLDGESPGSFDSRFSAGRIIPESYFPSFNPVLKKNNFYKGENVNSISSTSTRRYMPVQAVADVCSGVLQKSI